NALFCAYFDEIDAIKLVNTTDNFIVFRKNRDIVIKANSDIAPDEIVNLLIQNIIDYSPNKDVKCDTNTNINIKIEGIFGGKSKQYSEGIIKLKFDEYLSAKENAKKLLEFNDNKSNICVKIENIDSDAI